MTRRKAPRDRWRSACKPGRSESCGGLVRARFQQRRYEFLRVEHTEILALLAHADEADGNLQFLRDGEHHASLGGAVELGDDQPGYSEPLVEVVGLCDRILADGA